MLLLCGNVLKVNGGFCSVYQYKEGLIHHAIHIGHPCTANYSRLFRSNPSDTREAAGAVGYHVQVSDNEDEVMKLARKVDASILHLSLADVARWVNCLGKGKSDTPLLWWCAPDTASSSAHDCEVETSFDGIVTPSMSGPEIHWTLHFAARRYMERKQWEQERKHRSPDWRIANGLTWRRLFCVI